MGLTWDVWVTLRYLPIYYGCVFANRENLAFDLQPAGFMVKDGRLGVEGNFLAVGSIRVLVAREMVGWCNFSERSWLKIERPQHIHARR